MVIDDVLPAYDANRVEHVTVGAEPVRVYANLLEVDLMQARREGTGGRAMFAARDAPGELARRVRGRRRPPPEEPLRLEELDSEGTWVKLGEDFGKEFVFGAVGWVHGTDVVWRPVEASAYTGFKEPGSLKIAVNLSVQSFGIGRSVLSCEARARATDDRARRRMLLLWRAGSPAIRVAMRGSLNHIRRLSEG
jgi:hypothetical protein